MGDDADVLALGLQDGALFDMQLEQGVDPALADGLVALVADTVQFRAELAPLGILAPIGPVLRVDAGKDAAGQHGGGEARALFVGPVHHDDGAARADA